MRLFVAFYFIFISCVWGQSLSYQQVLNVYYSDDLSGAHTVLEKWVTLNPVSSITRSDQLQRDILKVLISLKEPVSARVQLPDAIPDDYHAYLTPVYFNQLLMWGRYDDAMVFLEDVRNSSIDRFYIYQLELDLASYYVKDYRHRMAAPIISRLVKDKRSEDVQYEAFRLLITIALREKDQRLALRYYGEIMQRFPNKDLKFNVFKKIQDQFQNKIMFSNCFLGPDQWFKYLKSSYRQNLQNRTIDIANTLINKYPNFSNLGDVYFIQSMVFFDQSKYDLAVQGYVMALKNPSISKKLRYDSLFYLAQTYQKLGAIKHAEETYDSLIRLLPKSHTMTSKVYYYKTMLHHENGSVTSFLKSTRRIHKRYFRSLYYQKLNWEANSSTTDVYHTRFTTHQLMKSIGSRVGMGQGNQYGTDHYDWVYRAGLADYVMGHLRADYIKKNTDSVVYFQAYLISKKGDYSKSIELLSPLIHRYQVIDKLIPVPILKLYYPIYFSSFIKDYSKRFDIDPYLVLALIRELSLFNGISREDNRLGLLRLDIKVVRELSFRKEGLMLPDIFDPKRNIYYGCRYLMHLKRLFDNDWYGMIVAFISSIDMANAIMGDVTMDNPETVYQIQYPQLRNRLITILNDYRVYKHLYPTLFEII